MKIIFATNNKHKLKEVQAVLGDGYRLVTPSELGITEEIPEDRPTIEGNASQKSHYLYERTGADCSRSRRSAGSREFARHAMRDRDTIRSATWSFCCAIWKA